MRTTIFTMIAVGLFTLGACTSQTDDPTPDDKSEQQGEELHVCPYAVPYCDTSIGCKLVGGCPQTCVCPQR